MKGTMRALLCVLFGFCAAICSLTIYFVCDRLEYRECHAYIPHQEVIDNNIMTNNEAICTINKLCNHEFDIEYVQDVDYHGQIRFFAVFDNTIYINECILEDRAAFVWAYTHEAMHATHFCIDERKTQYFTFVFLYESDNDYFREIALYEASNMINNPYKEYDATYYISEYLKNKK
ncbi:MAG: hypothetical protein IJU58_01825 [Clostridia bacterium]|nr:hypothetical protein [Clostridia bacterium]